MSEIFKKLEQKLEEILEGPDSDSRAEQGSADPENQSADVPSIQMEAGQDQNLDTTHSLHTAVDPAFFPQEAFLILEDNHIPINGPVLNLGRRRDNQVLLNDRTVSRTHAQIRARDQHFLLIDLGSSTGTFVNGNRIRQAILHSGDVISIGRHQLVYYENPVSPDTTAALNPVTPPPPVQG